MKKTASLILDNNSHKCLCNIDGKQVKISIDTIANMTVIEANQKIYEVNTILQGEYSLKELKLLYNFSLVAGQISRFSPRAIEIAVRIMYPKEINELKDNTLQHNEPIKILNIGCTGSGKTLYILQSLLPLKYVNIFSPLTSIKESTNFPIIYIVNSEKLVDSEEFEIELEIKSKKTCNENIYLLILESILEFFDTIKQEINKQTTGKLNNKEIWKLALEKALKRLGINKLKTFVIKYLINTDDLLAEFEKMILQGIKKYFAKSTSYNEVLTDEVIKNNIIDELRNNSFELQVDKINDIFCTTTEFENIKCFIIKKLDATLQKFKDMYHVDLNYNSKAKIRISLNDKKAKELIQHIFGDKKKRKEKDFYSIEVFINRAKIYFKNNEINVEKEIQLFDGLGINQGDSERDNVYNIINASIQTYNPNIILYHTLINCKDDYILDVINKLNEQGYGNNIFTIYGRLDTTLEDYCKEEDIEFESISPDNFKYFEDYIKTEYLNESLISIDNIIKNKYYLCDKTCTIFKKTKNEYYLNYTPKAVLDKILKEFQQINKVNTKIVKLDKCIQLMDQDSIFEKMYNQFINEGLDTNIPMYYYSLPWNTLEYGIRTLFNNGYGYHCLFPSLTLRNYFSNYLQNNCFKELFGVDYNNIVKELLYNWTNIIHTIMVTSYKNEYLNLLEMRYDLSKRNRLYLTMTDERKYVLRDIYSKCFEQNNTTASNTLREVTIIVLKEILTK